MINITEQEREHIIDVYGFEPEELPSYEVIETLEELREEEQDGN